ncbi:MAG: bifunctional phosphoribosyl-AMP cyclohydrolase/phosphoribosyl-ATP diphosphatase HisIE [Rudaea sp.]
MNELDLDWNKGGGLLPAIVQDARSGAVLMLGYMNAEALARTQQGGKVTFYSRSKQRLWTKGETTGNHLLLKSVRADCDNDTLLIQVEPIGPTCHQGTRSCFGDDSEPELAFLAVLDALVARRVRELPAGSYTTALFEKGIRRIAQKVGEEGVETALAATTGDDGELLDEAADLLFHLIVLLHARDKSVSDVVDRLRKRHDAAAIA